MKRFQCEKINCPNLKKRLINNNYECTITGKLPGNMNFCPEKRIK